MPRTHEPDKDRSGTEVFASLTAELADVMYLLRVEPDLAFEYVSPSVQALVGYTPEEHYADPQLGWRIVDPRDVDVLHTMVTAPVGEVSDVVIRWRAKDGGKVWTHHRGRKQQRPDGSVVV
jgi:PAS domain-containing protein